jgi:hypothetical protein
MSPERNGQAATESPTEELDPVAEADALRLALVESVRRAGRLITSLRQLQKQRRALHAAWSSLRHLGLGPKEEV